MYNGGETAFHDPLTNLLYVEVQALGRNAKHRSHKTTGNIYRHDFLVTALVTHNATAHQTLLYNLEGQKVLYMYCNMHQKDTHLLYEIQSLSIFTLGAPNKLSHPGGVWHSRQHHVNGAAWEKLHSRRSDAEHRLLFARGEKRPTVWTDFLFGSRDRGQ